MAVQNMYNNYLKRQKQNSTNQFRQKVANSLSGKPATNPTTQSKTPAMMGNTVQNTLGSGVQNKPTNVSTGNINKPLINPQTPINTNKPLINPQAPVTPSNAITNNPNTITPNLTTNGLESNIEPSTAISGQGQSITNQEITPGVGMMSLSDINQAINGDNQTNPQSQPSQPTLDESDMQAVEQLANTPSIGRMAKAQKKTPQQLAQELLETQKKALQEQWKQQKKELEQQRDQLKESYKQSQTDAENTYKESEKTLQENRYTQQEDLAVSGQKRGIQYSPQQLALENVANINLNKNLAEASNKRNELLNNLAIQLSQSLANVNMGLQSASVEYNTNVSNLMAEYQKQMADWAYNDQQTQADRDFQKEMADLQNKWQAEQNALDRKQYGKSSSGYSGYSYGRSYTPYSSYSGSSKSSARSYTPYSNDLDLSSKEGSSAFLDTFKNTSTDLYNALSTDSFYDVNERGQVYIDEIDKMIEYAKKNGASSEDIAELQKTRQVATRDLYKKWYGKNTAQDYQIEDTVYKPNLLIDKKKAEKTKKDAITNASKYHSIVGRTNLERNASKNLAKTINNINSGKAKSITTQNKNKAKSEIKKRISNNTKAGSTRDFVYKPKNTTTKKTTPSKTTKKVSTSIKNVSTAKKKIQATTNKKASQNNSKRTQSKFQKSFSNLKKNIKKLFKW